MKRAALERHLREHGCRQVDEGAKHTKWVAAEGPGRSAVPRHRDIKTGTVRAICNQLGIPSPTSFS